MKLNLGCGNHVIDDYINVDIRKTHADVVVSDLSIFPWKCDDNSADEILMLDFLEHFSYNLTNKILLECYRILKKDCCVIIQVPDGQQLCNVLSSCSQEKFYCNRCGYLMNKEEFKCQSCNQLVYQIQSSAIKRMYGGQDYAGNFHNNLFTKQILTSNLITCGFSNIEFLEEEHQAKNWNFMIKASKDDLW